MSIELRNANALEVLNSINYIDSTLFGFSIDIFKIRLFISAQESSRLIEFGFDEGYAHLCLEFRLVENLKIDINKSVFTPPYLEDGDLAAAHLLDFDFELLDLKKVGSTGQTDRMGEYGEMRDIHEVRFTFRHAAMQFQFIDLEISTFEPLDLDKRYSLNSGQE
jgi:hypothetical protein